MRPPDPSQNLSDGCYPLGNGRNVAQNVNFVLRIYPFFGRVCGMADGYTTGEDKKKTVGEMSKSGNASFPPVGTALSSLCRIPSAVCESAFRLP